MIAQFALQLVLGMSLVWALLPRAQITGGFFRIQMMIAMALGVLAALTVGRLNSTVTGPELLTAQIACGVIGLAGYLGAVLWLLNRRPAGTLCVFLILGASALGLVMLQSGTQPKWPGLLLVSLFSTAAVLGGAVTGMLLGHWYLTAPTMSIAPLKRASLLFGAAVLVRFLVSTVALFLVGTVLSDGTHWTWFALRWLAGIIGPLVIAVMAWNILRYRNTQAATGVLFAGVILSFIGELSAALLYSELQISL